MPSAADYGLKVTPSTLEVDFEKNLTQLYQAITDQDWKKATAVCKSKAVQAATWVVRHYEEEDGNEREIMWRFLPIHSACARQPPASFLAALINAYPDGARCVDDQGMYALHYACGNQASRDVIRQLLVACPEAAKIPDPRGMLPIHYLACWGPSSVAIVDMMLVAHRDVTEARDSEGNTPLDLALEGDYSNREEVVRLLRKWSGDDGRHFEEKKEEADDSSTEVDFHNKRREDRHSRKLGGNLLQMERDLLKLKMELMETKDELEAKELLLSQKEKSEQSFQEKVQELEHKLVVKDGEATTAQEELQKHKTDFQQRSESWIPIEQELKEVKEQLAESRAEADGLRKTLGDLMDQQEHYQRKSGNMNDRLVALSSTITSMLNTQSALEKSFRSKNGNIAYSKRAEKMRELLELEEDIKKSEITLEMSLKKQTRELEALAAVVKAAQD